MTGHKRDRYGWRVFVKVGTIQREKRFPPDSTHKQREAWRQETAVALRKIQSVAPVAGTFAADIRRYQDLVQAMPTLAQRLQHLQLWADALGPSVSRRAITASDIRAVLQAWRASGLEAATCNKRRTALMHLWSTLDGKGASNPVRDVPKFPVSDPLPRGKDPHTIDKALRAAPRCRSRACCRVLLWTGMRPVELARADPDDLDLRHRTVIAKTAKGGRTRVIALTTQAVLAWREFERVEAWHRVPQAAPLNRWLKATTGLAIRVYDLRHSYGTALARRGTRLDVIAAMMGHSTLELTKRYTLAAVAPDALTATRKLATAGRAAGSPKRANNDGRKSA